MDVKSLFSGSFGNVGSDQIQVHINRTSQDGSIAKQGLVLETAFPKPAGAVVFSVRFASNALGQLFHEPADIRQSAAIFLNQSLVVDDRLEFIGSRFTSGPSIVFAFRKQVPDSFGDFRIGPCFYDVGTIAEDNMKVIAHHGIAENIDPIVGRQMGSAGF